MKPLFGAPGIGGSLGTCAICGKPFTVEILLGKPIHNFEVPGIKNSMFAHDDCAKLLVPNMTYLDLPPGPLRKAFEDDAAAHQAKP